MHIFFIGQRGISLLSAPGENTREKRVEAIAQELIAAGHAVTVSAKKSFTPRNFKRFNGVELFHCASNLRLLFFIWRHKPEVVHVQGWEAGKLLRWASFVSPASTFVWTVDTVSPLRDRVTRRLFKRVTKRGITITATTRQLQYYLRLNYNLATQYVPDGYTAPVMPDVSLKKYGVRSQQYCVTTATTIPELRWVARGYKNTGNRKPLVTFLDITPEFKRLVKRYPFVTTAGQASERVLTSLIRHAAVVIFAGTATNIETVLHAMDSERAIIATTDPLYEETLGVTAQFVKAGDEDGMTAALKKVITRRANQQVWGELAGRRAVNHFTWERIVIDYRSLYRVVQKQAIPIDSAQAYFPEGKPFEVVTAKNLV